MELFKASNQWSQRPADERFWNVQDLHDACSGYQMGAKVVTVPYTSLRAVGQDAEVQVVGAKGIPQRLTNWAFGQLSARAEAPANFLRTLPAPLAAQAINVGLERRSDSDDEAQLLFHQNGSWICRAMTSERYTRIWNSDVTRRLLSLVDRGWRTPPARPFPGADQALVRLATEADLVTASKFGLSVKLGDPIAPAGLYASDHDMFAFLINEERPIDGGNGEFLHRGFFVWNSEVGAASFGVMTFLFEAVCGNHIVWGAKGVHELRVRHIGNADDRAFAGLAAELVKYSDESASDTEAKIQAAKRFVIAETKDQVLDRIFGLRMLSRKTISDGYDLAEAHADVHGAPNTAWGLVSGLTRLSQQKSFTDERVALDRAAGKVMDLVF